MNTSSEIYTDVDVIIHPDKPIIRAKAKSDFVSCKLGPVGGFLRPVFFGSHEGGAAVNVADPTEEDEDILIGPPFRLFCEKMPPETSVVVDLATVDPILSDSGEMWKSKRRDPKSIIFETSISVKELSFAKTIHLVQSPEQADKPISPLVEAPVVQALQ